MNNTELRGCMRQARSVLVPFRNLFATAQTQQPATINSATTHAFAWHSQHKTSIQYVSTTYLLGSPGVTMEFWRTFCKDRKKKKVHPNSTITPGYPGGYVVLTCCMPILCCECQAKVSSRRRRLMVAGCCFWVWQTNSETAIMYYSLLSCILGCLQWAPTHTGFFVVSSDAGKFQRLFSSGK